MTEKQETTGGQQHGSSPSQSSWGCLSIVVLCFVMSVIAMLLILASAIGGFGSYFIAHVFDFEPKFSAIAGAAFGGIAGGIGAIAGPPAGWLLAFLGNNESKTFRVAASAVVGLISPFLHFHILVVAFVIAAIGSGFAYHAFEPFRAAVYVGIGAPLAGFIFGVSIGSPPATIDG